jgi:hypothetical protein
MKNRFIIVVFICLAAKQSKSQNLLLNIQGGLANYQGDLQELPYTLGSSGLHLGLSLHYGVANKINIRAGGAYGKIKATDALSSKKGNKARNLSFENKITEFHLGAEYFLWNTKERNWTPYIFGGIAYFKHNPYAFDATGNKVFLEPLRTEGQGLPEYPNRKTYKLSDFSLPIGGGIRVVVSDNLALGYEIGFRKTFTDYLDDVSTTYPDEVKLLGRRGIKAVEMSYRGGELFGGSNIFPAENFIRGSAKNKDWYYFQSITIGLNLFKPDGGLLGGGNKYRTKCPRF